MDPASRERFGRFRQLKESFEEWCRLGTVAAKRRDVAAMDDAIQAHAAILREQRRLLAELMRDAEAQRPASASPSSSSDLS
jgi:hypothetical protein